MTSRLNTQMAPEDFEQVSIRVINKLTLCVNPSSLIMPKITDMTGLDNYNLEKQKNFTSRTVLVCSYFRLKNYLSSCMISDKVEEFTPQVSTFKVP